MLLFFVLETYISLGSISFQEIMYLEEGLLYFQEKWADSYWKKTVKKQSISSMKQHWSVFCFVSQLAMITSMNTNKWILDIISLWPTHIRPDSLPTENPVGVFSGNLDQTIRLVVFPGMSSMCREHLIF